MISSESIYTTSNNNLKKPTAFIVNFEDTNLNSSSAKTTSSTTTTSTTISSNNSSSLQDAFKKYRDEKIKARSIYESNKAKRKSFRTNPERMWRLRLKFLEQAKKFLGVPYAKKYFSPGTPEYNSKLFLDCCGLVRRVMRDLEDDFGFRIGSGNQNYMWDTLPIEVKRLEDVKPGDLVFTSGIYFNPKMKKQPHGITHVEIMLGEGEKTIGARWNNGKVSFFDSYKFESKSFHSAQYYFRSLDPWLWGYCRSFCSKHSWPYNTMRPNRKSIFYTKSEREKRKSKSDILNKSAELRIRKNSTKSTSNKSKKSKRKIKKARLTSRPKLSKDTTSLSLNSKKCMDIHANHSYITNRNILFNNRPNTTVVKTKTFWSPRIENLNNNNNDNIIRTQEKEEEEDDNEEVEFTEAAEEEQEAAAEEEDEENDDDNNDVLINNKQTIKENNDIQVFDGNNALDVENVLKILSDIEKQEDYEYESDSECDSKYVNGKSDSEFDFNSNFTSDDYDSFSQYSSDWRRLDYKNGNHLYNDDQDEENDDNDDIRISAIQNNFRILSIDN